MSIFSSYFDRSPVYVDFIDTFVIRVEKPENFDIGLLTACGGS